MQEEDSDERKWNYRILAVLMLLTLWGMSIVTIWFGNRWIPEYPKWVQDLQGRISNFHLLESLKAESNLYAESGFSYAVHALGKDRYRVYVTGENFAEKRKADEEAHRFEIQFSAPIDTVYIKPLSSFRTDDCLVKQGQHLITYSDTEKKFMADDALFATLAANYYAKALRGGDSRLFGAAMLSLFVLLALGVCIYQLRKSVMFSFSRMTLCFVCVQFHILVVVLYIFLYKRMPSPMSFYLLATLPVPLVPSLISTLLGRRVGIILAMMLSVLTPLLVIGIFQNHFQFPYFCLCFLESALAVLIFQNAQKRRVFLQGGGVLLLIGVISNLFLVSLQNPNWFCHGEMSPFWGLMIIFVAIKVLVILFAVSFLPVMLEVPFDVTSVSTLKELQDKEHPLLKELQEKAKGTYEHSQNVADLAENAARVIGVNKEMVRVCALYHDIGKLSNPDCFAENNFSENFVGKNPHDHYNPLESCSILRSHVVKGAEYAKNYHLPRLVQNTCLRHHGNGLMQGFYAKAVGQAEEARRRLAELEAAGADENALAKARQDVEKKAEILKDKAAFTYNSPLPEAPEVVLVAMADCTEAAARSWIQRWQSKQMDKDVSVLRAELEKLLMTKLSEHQYDKAHLTLAQFQQIIASFLETLCAKNHLRPEYEPIPKTDDNPPSDASAT